MKGAVMKKIVLIALILTVFAVGSGFAANQGWALGASFYLTYWQTAAPTGVALSVKFPGLPVMFGFSAAFDPTWTAFGITADWWLFQTHLVGPLDLYIGPGLFFVIRSFAYGATDFDGGLRIPVGFQIFIVKAFEIFLEPAFALHIAPTTTFPNFGFMAAAGFRFWF
jgi:hypothetical protein